MGAVFHSVVLAAVCAVYSTRHAAQNSIVGAQTTAGLFYPSPPRNGNKKYLKPTQYTSTRDGLFHSSGKHHGYKSSHESTERTTMPFNPLYSSAKHNGYSQSQAPNAHIPTAPLRPLHSERYRYTAESNKTTAYTSSRLVPFDPPRMHSGYNKSHVRTTRKPKPFSYPCDKYCCGCNGDKAECVGTQRNLTYLPRVPAKTREFRMWEANLQSLTRSMLANLSNFNIGTMDLSRNEIHYVEKDAFLDFVHLRSLRLSGNHISAENLREAFWSLSEKFDRIWLDNMELPDLPEDFFAAFRNRTFSTVDLQKNRLTTLDSAVFSVFWRVDRLVLSENRIGTVKLLKRAHIHRLLMEWSDLRKVPDFCLQSQDKEHGNESVNAFINLVSVYLSNGLFSRMPPFRGHCLPNLIKLDVGGARTLSTLEDNFIADLPKLTQLRIYDMKRLKEYKPYCLNSSSLKEVYFSNNRQIKSKPSRAMDIFRYCPNLEVLTIENMKVKLDISEFRQMLLPLESLRELKLNFLRVGNIPEDFLWRFPKLKSLTFSRNSLTSLGLGRALIKVKSLEYLNVEGNSITVVNENTLPWEFRQNIKEIDLSHNPFACTCELLWFRKWLDDVTRNKSITVTSFGYRKAYPRNNSLELIWEGSHSGVSHRPQYICTTPEDMKYVHLQLFNPTEESCAIKNPYIVIGVAIGCFVGMVIVAGVLCYRYRWHLRYYIYRLRRSPGRARYRQGFEGNADGGGEVIPVYKYDVYLAHSAQDVDWIVQELLPLLEEEHGLNVFLEERNAVGGSVGDNIARYMDESARVMLVVSDNYNREGWRQYEFEHILYATFEQQKEVIVLLLGDVEAGRMTQDMRRMLTRGTFLQWGPGEDAKRHFRNGLKVALRTQDVGIDEMC